MKMLVFVAAVLCAGASPALADSEGAPMSAEGGAAEAPKTLEPAAEESELLMRFDAPPVDGEEVRLLEWDTQGLTLAPIGLIQGQIALLTGDDNLLEDGDPAEREGFRLRRARFGLEGAAFDVIDFEVSLEAASEYAELLAAWIAYRKGTWLGATIGAHKMPFSRFALSGGGKQTLTERSLGVRAMAPFRQIGMTVHGEVADRIFSYSLGIFNGFERNRNFFQGHRETSGFEGNRFTNLAYAARLETEPIGRVGDGMADLDHGPFRFGIGGAFFFNDGETTEQYGWEADLLMKVAGFHLAVEYIADHAAPKTQPTTTSDVVTEIDRSAFIGELGYMILKRRLGVAVRAELIDDNADLDSAGDALVITGGLQYYWHRHHLKAQIDFTHREESHEPSRDNDTLLLQLQFEL